MRLDGKSSPEQERALLAFKEAVRAKKQGEDISMDHLRELAKAAGVERFLDAPSTAAGAGGKSKLRRLNRHGCGTSGPSR